MKKKRTNQQTQRSGDYEWTIYRDEHKKWHWYKQRAKGSGEILGQSHKGFSSKQQCIHNATFPGLKDSHEWKDKDDWEEQ